MGGAVSSGSTLLNLACSDHPSRGFLKGGYYYLVGDSMSGKTWLTLTCFAEACLNPEFKNHRLIFDNVEGGALMDIKNYFGKEVVRRMEQPSKKGSSTTVQSFYYNLYSALETEEPFIYVLDSQDSLDSDSAQQKFKEQQEAFEKGKETSGSYTDGKAKYHSEHLRQIIGQLRKSKSILIIIGQTRDNLGFGFETKSRAGGKALRFYANIEIWTSPAGKIEKQVRGKKRTVGVRCFAEVKKNRVSGKIGKDRTIEIPIYYGHGIDDVGSCVDYLISENHWKKTKGEYDAKEIFFKGSKTGIIRYVEEEGLEEKLRSLVASVWNQIDEESQVKRKKRYE